MDAEGKHAFAQTRLEAAHEDLTTASHNLKDDLLRAAVNRAYYAIFHAASAALAWHGIERSRHSGIESAFGEYLVKTKVIEPECGRIFNRIRDARARNGIG